MLTLLDVNAEEYSKRLSIPLSWIMETIESMLKDDQKLFIEFVRKQNPDILKILFTHSGCKGFPCKNRGIKHLSHIDLMISEWTEKLSNIKEISVFVSTVYPYHPTEVEQCFDYLASVCETELVSDEELLSSFSNDLGLIDNQTAILVRYAQLRNAIRKHGDDSEKELSFRMTLLGNISSTITKYEHVINVFCPEKDFVKYFGNYLQGLEYNRKNVFQAEKTFKAIAKVFNSMPENIPVELFNQILVFRNNITNP